MALDSDPDRHGVLTSAKSIGFPAAESDARAPAGLKGF